LATASNGHCGKPGIPKNTPPAVKFIPQIELKPMREKFGMRIFDIRFEYSQTGDELLVIDLQVCIQSKNQTAFNTSKAI
jgi:thermostable 8-oxoguanine DNA glycosylase